jgi:hypothetical protein
MKLGGRQNRYGRCEKEKNPAVPKIGHAERGVVTVLTGLSGNSYSSYCKVLAKMHVSRTF